jgi:Restriction endonuclease
VRIENFSGEADLSRVNAALNALTSNIRFFRSSPEPTRKVVVESCRGRLLDWGEGLLRRGSLPIEGYTLATEIVSELGRIISPDLPDTGLQSLARQLKDRGEGLQSWWEQINDEHPRAYVGMTSTLVGVIDGAESLLAELRLGIDEAGLAPRVEIVQIDAQVEELVRHRFMPRGGALATDPIISALRAMSPQEFEDFVAGELRHNGFEVHLVGRVNTPDGGIDMIANGYPLDSRYSMECVR